MTCTVRYKWVDVTNELTQRLLPGLYAPSTALQFIHEGRVIFVMISSSPSSKWKISPGLPLQEGEYRVVLDYNSGNEYGISAVDHRVPRVVWRDITRECRVELRASQHTTGHYGIITHMGERIMLLGTNGITPCANISSKYKLVKPDNARVSFSIFKKEMC